MEKLRRIWYALPPRGKQQMAQQLGVNYSTLCRWVAGNRKPHFKKMIRLKEMLGIDFEDWR